MPYRDGTGPEGRGSRTGRGMGDCYDGKEIEMRLDDPNQVNWWGRLFRNRRSGRRPFGRRNRRKPQRF